MRVGRTLRSPDDGVVEWINEHVIGQAAMAETDLLYVLDVVRATLAEHMSNPEFLEHCRVRQVRYIAQSGRVLAPDTELCDDDAPAALLLLMHDGAEYRLTLTHGVQR